MEIIIATAYVPVVLICLVFWLRKNDFYKVVHLYQMNEQFFCHTELTKNRKANRELVDKALKQGMKFSIESHKRASKWTAVSGFAISFIGIFCIFLMRLFRENDNIALNDIIGLYASAYLNLLDKLTFDLFFVIGKSTTFSPESPAERFIYFIMTTATVLAIAQLLNAIFMEGKARTFTKLFPVSTMRAAKQIRIRRQPQGNNKRWTSLAMNVLDFEKNVWYGEIKSYQMESEYWVDSS